MKKTIKLIRTYTTTFEIEADSNDEAMQKFMEIPDDIKYLQELEQMDVDEYIEIDNN